MNVALLIVEGVLVVTVNGLAVVFRVERVFNRLSVIIRLQEAEGLVVEGFLIPFTVILKVCMGFIPMIPPFNVICAFTEFVRPIGLLEQVTACMIEESSEEQVYRD